MTCKTRRILWLIVAALFVGALLFVKPTRFLNRVRVTTGVFFDENSNISKNIDLEFLDESLKLGRNYFLKNQLPDGRFVYEYDWRADKDLPDDGAVRQAGAFWGLTLLYKHFGDSELRAAVEKAVKFWHDATSIRSLNQSYFIVYPGDEQGSLGTVALAALAHVELLRYLKEDDPLRANLDEYLLGYLKFITYARKPDGRFHSRFSHSDGQPFGQSSPYFDGEALLAMVKAAKYAGHTELWDFLTLSAERGYIHNIQTALSENPDSDTTKGYYQWSSMAFFELATSGRPETEVFADRVIDLAKWMIHTHHTLFCTRNTAYAYEGMIHARELARQKGDKRMMAELDTVIDIGLEQLTSWQVGHSAANGIAMLGTAPERALGGIQNNWLAAPLRIDVVQHQMHAVLLARQYIYSELEK